MDITYYISLAAEIAKSKNDKRSFKLGAVAIRNDGTIVKACNGPTMYPVKKAHAEARLSRKIDKNSIVFVVRVKADGTFGMSKPCKSCQVFMKAAGVKHVFYTSENGIKEMRI